MIFGMKTPDRELEFCASARDPNTLDQDMLRLFLDRRNASIAPGERAGDDTRVWFRSRFWNREWQDCTDDFIWSAYEQQMFDWEDELRRKREER